MLGWKLRWGSEIGLLLEIQESTGITPRGLQERPEIRPECLKYWEAFWILSGSRGSAGMNGNPLPIPVSEVLAYLELTKEDEVVERLKILRMVQVMDMTYVAHLTEKAKK